MMSQSMLAPPTDYFGCARTATPDIGAIQFGACPLAPGPAAAAAAITHSETSTTRVRAKARILSLRSRRLARRVEVFVRCSNATRLAAALLVRGRVVASSSHLGTSRDGVKFTLRAPRSGRVEVRVRAVGAGGSDTRTITVKALPA